MDATELEKRKARAVTETLVIAPTEGGFRVYNPASITNLYMVTGIPESPTCNCPDYTAHANDPDWRCKHILAVLNKLEKQKLEPAAPAERPTEAARAGPTQPEINQTEKKKSKPQRSGQSQMRIKRSVSPDGYIDSLSVDFLTPIEPGAGETIKLQAHQALLLQAEIVDEFLKVNGNGKNKPQAQLSANGQKSSKTNENGSSNAKDRGRDNGQTDESDGTEPARLLNIAGMDTRDGWMTFINVQVNGRTTKLFGNRQELGKHITAAGFASIAAHISQGMMLNLPCRVITKPSPNGKYLNIEKIFPAKPLQSNGRAGQ